jgi:hypothetical protein
MGVSHAKWCVSGLPYGMVVNAYLFVAGHRDYDPPASGQRNAGRWLAGV